MEITSVRRAFSLIELLVVVGIFTVISTIVLANHSRFNSSVLLGSLAYDIALSVREAQVYGLSVRGVNANFQVGYGVHFATANSYILFADTNANKKYDDGTGSEPADTVVSSYSLSAGHQISRFCGVTALGAEECSDTSVIDRLDIVFFRPDPDAVISSANPGIYSAAHVTVRSSVVETRTISIASTGQISVANP